MTSTQSIESSLVALTLSGVERLRIAFVAAGSEEERRNFLLCAADLMDRTLPPATLQPTLKAAAGEPVPVLVAHRHEIAAVPPGLWRETRVKPSQLPSVHCFGLRALDLALRRDFSNPQEQRARLQAWLAPAWDAYPSLKDEALALLPAATCQA